MEVFCVWLYTHKMNKNTHKHIEPKTNRELATGRKLWLAWKCHKNWYFIYKKNHHIDVHWAVQTNYIHIWDHLVNCSMIVCEFNALKSNSSSSSSSPCGIYVVLLSPVQPACWWKLLIWSDFQLCDVFLLNYFSHSFFENIK